MPFGGSGSHGDNGHLPCADLIGRLACPYPITVCIWNVSDDSLLFGLAAMEGTQLRGNRQEQGI